MTCAYAENAGFRNEKALVSNAKAPYDNKYTNIQWQLDAAENVGAPVVYGDSVLIPSGSEILQYSEANGSKMTAVKLDSEISTEYSGAVMGSTLVQPLKNGICTIDLKDGSVTASREFSSIGSDVAVIDDMAYFSAKNDGGETFYCVKLDSTLSTVWNYTAESDITSPTVQGDFVIFGAGDDLVTCHYKNGSAQLIPIGAEITKTPFASQYAVFITTGDTSIKLRLNDDGALEEDSLLSCKTGEGSSAPLAYDSRLYVTSAEGLHIIDSINMEITHTIPEIKNGSDPFICRGNGTRVYTISEYSEEQKALHSVFDISEDEQPTDSKLALLDNYDGGKSAVSENGTLYFRDGTGRVFALTCVEYNIFSIVMKLILTLALIAGVFIWIRMIAKRKSQSRPKF